MAGAFGWPVAWVLLASALGDQGALNLYPLALAGAFAGLSVGWPVWLPDQPATRWLGALVGDTSGLGFTLAGVMLIALAGMCGYNAAAL
jgi:hypothetical protein